MSTATSDTYGADFRVSYEAPSYVQRFHNQIFRFGHSDNLASVFGNNGNNSKDYFMGLIFAGCFILCFFILWGVLLIYFLCKGSKAGFLSGAAFVRQEQLQVTGYPTDEEVSTSKSGDEPLLEKTSVLKDIIAYEKINKLYDENDSSSFGLFRSLRIGRRQPSNSRFPLTRTRDPWLSRPTISRLIFILSGVLCITFSLLFVTKGITNIQTGITTIQSRVTDLNALVGGLKVLIYQGLDNVTLQAVSIGQVFKDELAEDRFCPNHPLASAIESTLTKQIRQKKQEALNALEDLEDFRNNEMEALENGIGFLYNASLHIMDISSSYDATSWKVLVCLLPLTIIPSLFIASAVMAHFGVSSYKYNLFINFLILPAFVIITIITIGCGAAMSLASNVVTDFCFPGGHNNSSPDQIVLSIIESSGLDKKSFPYQVAEYYIGQCRPGDNDPMNSLRTYQPQFLTSQATGMKDFSLDSFLNLFAYLFNDQMLKELSDYCGRDYSIMVTLLNSVSDIVQALSVISDNVLDLSKCERVVPIYTDTVYQAGCLYSPKSVFWVYGCCVALSFFGMLMITLRSSLKLTVYEQNYMYRYDQSVVGTEAESQYFVKDGEESDIGHNDSRPLLRDSEKYESMLDEYEVMMDEY